MTTSTLPLIWEPLPTYLTPLGLRLLAELKSWEGTPHMPGQKCKGAGVDCVRFVIAVLESWTGSPPTRDVQVPQDASMHSPKTAFNALRFFLESWPNHVDASRSGRAQPGDILVVGPVKGGPGHAIIVGPEPNTLWQASSCGVYRGGWILERPMTRVFRAYRGSNREVWL